MSDRKKPVISLSAMLMASLTADFITREGFVEDSGPYDYIFKERKEQFYNRHRNNKAHKDMSFSKYYLPKRFFYRSGHNQKP